jgi:hypothetical protein
MIQHVRGRQLPLDDYVCPRCRKGYKRVSIGGTRHPQEETILCFQCAKKEAMK